MTRTQEQKAAAAAEAADAAASAEAAGPAEAGLEVLEIHQDVQSSTGPWGIHGGQQGMAIAGFLF